MLQVYGDNSNLANIYTARVTATFASMGFNAGNMEVIFEVGEDGLRSWQPGRAINPITGTTEGKGYYIVSKQDLDVSEWFETDGSGGDAASMFAALVDGPTISWDITTGRKKTVTLGGNRSLEISGATNGEWGILEVTQDATGGHTLEAYGEVLPINAAANSVSTVGFYIPENNRITFTVDANSVSVSTLIAPAAPTAAVVDDVADTFNWTNNPLFTALADYEFTINGGASYNDVVAKPIAIGNVNLAIGQVGVRVKSIGGNPFSATLYNASAFTASGPGAWSTEGGGFTITDQDLDLAFTPAWAKYSKHLPAGVDGWVEFVVDMGAGWGQTVALGLDPLDDFQPINQFSFGILASYNSNPANPTVWKTVAGTTLNTFIDVADGDILRLERLGGDLLYKHNGVTFLTEVADAGDLYVKAYASSPNPIRLRGFDWDGLI